MVKQEKFKITVFFPAVYCCIYDVPFSTIKNVGKVK